MDYFMSQYKPGSSPKIFGMQQALLSQAKLDLTEI